MLQKMLNCKIANENSEKKIYENENIPETAMMPCICETRIEAEEKAFEKAFFILEEKLVKILTKQE